MAMQAVTDQAPGARAEATTGVVVASYAIGPFGPAMRVPVGRVLAWKTWELAQ